MMINDYDYFMSGEKRKDGAKQAVSPIWSEE